MDINSEGRDVNIIPVMGGYIIRWRRDTFVEPPKLLEKNNIADAPKEKSMSVVGQYKCAVRETADGAMTLVKEILLEKMAFLQKEAQYANGGVSVEHPGSKSSIAMPSQAVDKYPQPMAASS